MENKNIYDEKQEQMRILSKYASVIENVFLLYSRKSADETMMVKSFRKSNVETTNRMTHSENLEKVAAIIAERVGLNATVVKLMARNHDIGHTFLGHSGEWWLSEIKKNEGLGCYAHNALGVRDLMYTHDVAPQIRKEIARLYIGDENAKDQELDKVQDALWLVFDGILSHNGELSESTYIPDFDKTKENFEQQLMDCHIKPGADKKIVPGTTEACLMRLCDKISYIPFDMVDGLREGMIDKLDEEYINVLVPILTSDGTMSAEEAVRFINTSVIKKRHQELAGTLQSIFMADVVKNSSKEKIAMSGEMSRLMHKLRDINNKQIVNYVLMEEDHEIYPRALTEFMHEFAGIIQDEGILSRLNGADQDLALSERLNEKYGKTPYAGFATYIADTNKKDFEWTQRMVKNAREEAMSCELDEALEIAKGEKQVPFVKGQEKRARRLRVFAAAYEEQISKMRDKGYSLDDEDYGKMKQFLLETQAPKAYPSFEESMALEFGTKYLATLSDTELMNLMRQTEKITDEQYASLTRKYKDIDLKSEYMTHGQWDKIAKEQSEATQEVR